MKRSTAVLLLFFLAFLQGWEVWDRAFGHEHELCEHGEWVHTSDVPGHPNAPSGKSHDHCNPTGAFAQALTLGGQSVVSQPVFHFSEMGVPAFSEHIATILLSQAPKTSPPA